MNPYNTVQSHPFSVLIVHDHPGLHDPLSQGLKHRGYNVKCVHEKKTALQVAATTSFDLAICDVMMADSQGQTFIEELKKASPDTEVILAAGFSTLNISAESTRGPHYDYIARPFSVNHLSDILEKALDRKRLQARVRQLEEMNRMKTEFMSMLGHELRTPITAIMGFTSLQMAGIYGQTTDDQNACLQRVNSNAETVLELLNRILDLSLLSSNRIHLTQGLFNLHVLAKEVLESLESLALQKKITLSLEGSDDVWVHADRIQLWQILVNLVANAVKFTDQGGVTVRLNKMDDRSHVALEIIDTGIGMRKEDVPMLFKEFKPLDADSFKRGGTGLGLSICKKILDLMGGSVSVDSEPGVGTTFHIRLPAGQVEFQAV